MCAWLVRPGLRAWVLGSAGGGQERSQTLPPSSSPARLWAPGTPDRAGSRCPWPQPSPLGALDMSLERAVSSACCQLTAAAGGGGPFKNKNSTQRDSPRGQSPAFGQSGQGFSRTRRCLDEVTGKHDAFWSGEVSVSRSPCEVARGCLSQGGDSLGSVPSGQAGRELAAGPWGASSRAPQPAPSFRLSSLESLRKGAGGGDGHAWL